MAFVRDIHYWKRRCEDFENQLLTMMAEKEKLNKIVETYRLNESLVLVIQGERDKEIARLREIEKKYNWNTRQDYCDAQVNHYKELLDKVSDELKSMRESRDKLIQFEEQYRLKWLDAEAALTLQEQAAKEEIEKWRDAYGSLKTEKERTAKELIAYRGGYDILQKTFTTLKNEVTRLDKIRDELKKELEENKKKYEDDTKTIRFTVDQLVNDNNRLRNRIREIKEEQKRELAASQTSYEHEINRLKEELANLNTVPVNRDLKECEEEIKRWRDGFQSLTDDIEKIRRIIQ